MNRLDIQIRDPFVVPVASEGRYYLYGTTDTNPWNARGHGFDAYTSSDLEEWDGPFQVFRPGDDFWGTHDFWAPEVHPYDDAFYMFATFVSPTRKRGTQILRSESLLGPFQPISDGPITPTDWHCLDGTLHVDGNRQPWIVFCREWVEVHDGQICAMPLDGDLRRPIGEATVLFRASAAKWTEPRARRDGSGVVDARVTDGPFLHRTSDGTLLMLWSSVGKTGYVMGYARSVSGSILGPWIQSEAPLIYADGGHGMIFRTFDGTLQLAYHSPNNTPEERFRYVEMGDADVH
jgi:beta-xylosidase